MVPHKGGRVRDRECAVLRSSRRSDEVSCSRGLAPYCHYLPDAALFPCSIPVSGAWSWPRALRVRPGRESDTQEAGTVARRMLPSRARARRTGRPIWAPEAWASAGPRAGRRCVSPVAKHDLPRLHVLTCYTAGGRRQTARLRGRQRRYVPSERPFGTGAEWYPRSRILPVPSAGKTLVCFCRLGSVARV